MHLERLVIDSGGHLFATDFHPRFTVLGGLDRGSRAALAGELIDALAGARPGVHLELQLRGRSLTVFRPSSGRHRVIDTDAVADVTDEHVGADGNIDLFDSLGVDRALGRRAIRVDRDDLVVRGATDELVRTLAAADQEELWEAAMRLRSAEGLLEHAARQTGASPADVELMNSVDSKHDELVEATKTYDRVRLISLTIADIGAIAGLTLAFDRGPMAGLPFLVMTVVGIVLALYYRRNVTRAEAAERKVLEATGADDYASFHVERVSALLEGDDERRRFMKAVTAHRQATEAWRAVAGDVSLVFALEHVDEVRAAASLHAGVRSLQHLSDSVPDLTSDGATELAQALFSRVDAVRALTADDETLPLVIDDAMEDLEPAVKPMLLELLAKASGRPQIILLSADEDVLSWARLEAMAGDVGVVEPRLEPSPASA